jgi:hypothetical protein
VNEEETTEVDDGQIESDTEPLTDVGTAGVDDGINVDTVPDLEEKQARLDAEMDSQYGGRTREHGLRPRRPRDYSHVHIQQENIVMTLHSIKKGLKVFGDNGAKAVVSEMTQLHERNVIKAKKVNMLTREEKQNALHYLMCLKKRCGRIKGRGCADRRKQRVCKTKKETSVPTVATETLMLSSIIDAKERRAVEMADIPGALMQADMDEVIDMKL